MLKHLKKRLEIYSTARAVRSANKSNIKGLQADKITIGDFFTYFSHSSKPRASNAVRTYCMHKASLHARSKLKLSEDFLNFLQDKEYLFSFFEELASQRVSINDLKSSDTYSFFDEYLISLEQVQKLYLEYLDELNFSDFISDNELLPNRFLLCQYDEIIIYLDGYLKEQEIQFISSLDKLKIICEISRFNKSLLEKSFKIDFEVGYKYEICFISGCASAKKLEPVRKPPKIEHAGFKNSLLQYLYVLYLCAKDVRDGIKPSEITIILCDEKKANILKALDVFNYLNIAKGLEDIAYSQKFSSLIQRCEHEMSKSSVIYKAADLKQLKELCEEALLELASDAQAREQLANQLAELQELSSYIKLDFSQKCKLLSPLSCAHVAGGEVSVIGALESRGMRSTSVIVCDFNDEFVPVRASAQMYLNAALRRKAGLISDQDRENLQRHYYYALFCKAERVRLLYVQNEESKPARFLRQLENIDELRISEASLLNSYVNQGFNHDYLALDESELLDWPEDANSHKFNDFALSYSRLSTLEHSGAEYYFKYILNISEPRALMDDAASIGTKMHALLETANFDDFDIFMAHFEPEINKLDSINALICKKNLKKIFDLFKAQEYESFAELKISAHLNDLPLVGYIDRYFQNGLMIDYKNSANINNEDHAKQFSFYALILGLLESAECGAKPVCLAQAEEYKALNIYLKAISHSIIAREIKSSDELIQKLTTYCDDFKCAKFKAQYARGYYYLLANKKRSAR